MGPRRYRRGNLLVFVDDRHDHLASMGPRRYRRGNRPRERFLLVVGSASMGPRRYRRGNHLEDQRDIYELIGFNGAATLSSRKLFTHNTSHARRCASMGPRRYRRGNARIPGILHLGRVASMGPRRYRRGNQSDGGYHLPEGELQWGRDVIVAEIAVSASNV